MSFSDSLNKYKNGKCYGPFCSIYSCGKFTECLNDKCQDRYWYPDQIKEMVLSDIEKKGVKTCDLLECTPNGIYIAEIKPRTKDVNAKVKGTCRVLKRIYPTFGINELQKLKAFLIRCVPNGKGNPNYVFRDTLARLAQSDGVKSLYENNACTIDGVRIPISYHKPCSEFIKEDLKRLFV